MSESIFERLYKEENSSVMNINYRMNASLTALANVVTYNGELLIGSDEVAQATLKIPNKQVCYTNKNGWVIITNYCYISDIQKTDSST